MAPNEARVPLSRTSGPALILRPGSKPAVSMWKAPRLGEVVSDGFSRHALGTAATPTNPPTLSSFRTGQSRPVATTTDVAEKTGMPYEMKLNPDGAPPASGQPLLHRP